MTTAQISSENAVPGLDPTAAERWAQFSPSTSPWLHEEIARRMVDRLQWFKALPTSWLHWEPVRGGLEAHQRLREVLPVAECLIHAQDAALAQRATREPAQRSWNPARWRRASQPAAAEPDRQVAMVWANMALHHVAQPMGLLKQWHQSVDTHGFLMFSCLGPDSLRELRDVFAAEGWPAPSHSFTDMHDWGDMLVACGFAEPVMDMERITLSYSTPMAMLDELRGLGRNLNVSRFQGLRSRAWRDALCAAIEQRGARGEDGRLILTFEVVYGHAYKPVPRVPLGPNQTVSMDDMRAMLQAGRR
ncbi:biotin synthase [Hydrogenophaga sp. PAMC20947]|uniref:biotin synthase n=1 Tax=Hydrogenophaga sp. PAMC20947 TaxID=2565558 RepID=UPI001FF933F1|nr:biotin synthase [Hydrogenophaga sp. PAMC20947]